MHENDHQSAILLRASDEEGILRLTLNDVARRNALSEAMLAELGGAIAEAGADRSTRVVVLAANGPAFSAGHDLKEMTAARAAPDRRAFPVRGFRVRFCRDGREHARPRCGGGHRGLHREARAALARSSRHRLSGHERRSGACRASSVRVSTVHRRGAHV